ncbi:DNA polymerase-3 subunit delta' [Desulfurobacterium pacificum]|uniref:DNA polymerase-3 subunit delta n=1 Tax=Desulfurobacterium pacificum TaxID=240166 RepID=A0ABY1NUG9_9BACT|nr:AAA family ATPase [Desulfurobacterium pacificum]SMP18647.1 DNA polymerase-3 subunit delta' [Desulfurobacterium pacificum]
MSLNTIIGHSFQINKIKELLQKDAFPQSSIFSGVEGIGKKLIAFEILKTLTKSEMNVKVIGTEKGATIEEIRESSSWLFTKPQSGTGKGLIIDNADEMRREAANALLKTLEEPPSYGYIILITKNENALLPTIKSRCKIFRFSRLNNSNVAYILEKQGLEYNEKILKLCGGSPGIAIRLLESQVPELMEEFSSFLKTKNKAQNLLKFSSSFANISREEMELFLTALENLLLEKDAFFQWMPLIQKAKSYLKFFAKPQSVIEWMVLSTLFKKERR